MDLLNDCVLIQMTPHVFPSVMLFFFFFKLCAPLPVMKLFLFCSLYVPPHMEHLGEFQLLYFGFSCFGLAN